MSCYTKTCGCFSFVVASSDVGQGFERATDLKTRKRCVALLWISHLSVLLLLLGSCENLKPFSPWGKCRKDIATESDLVSKASSFNVMVALRTAENKPSLHSWETIALNGRRPRAKDQSSTIIIIIISCRMAMLQCSIIRKTDVSCVTGHGTVRPNNLPPFPVTMFRPKLYRNKTLLGQ